MADPDDRLRYALTEEQHEQIFRRRVLRSELPPSARVENPTAVILGGQPGAGKTALLTGATLDLQAKGSTVTINGDLLRPYHPQYDTLQQSVPLDAARYTDHDSGRWVEKLIAAAQEQQVNLVIESTMRRPEVFARTAGQLHDAGYLVEARVIAVPERLSWQGVHQRYEAMLAAGDAGRFTARETHDAAASGMLETLRQIERTRSADRVLIADRAGTVLYDNKLVNGDWRDPPRGADVVMSERSRPRTAVEMRTVERGWDEVLDNMRRRQLPSADLARIRDLATADLQFFRAMMPPAATPSNQAPDPVPASPAVRDTTGRRDVLGTIMRGLRPPPPPSAPSTPDLPAEPLTERLRALEERTGRSRQNRSALSEEADGQEPAPERPKPRSGPGPA